MFMLNRLKQFIINLFEKLNISEIVYSHINTLSNEHGKKSKGDFCIFFILPLIIAVLFACFVKKLPTDTINLLVNFGSILVALLLSLLVLMYDRHDKLLHGNETHQKYKQELIQQLYNNICYAILIALCVVITCLLISLSNNTIYQKIFSILIMYLTSNLLLTILMIVKRIHALLTHQN